MKKSIINECFSKTNINILILSVTNDKSMYIIHKTLDIIHNKGLLSELATIQKHRQIIFNNGSKITFSTLLDSDTLRGFRFDLVLFYDTFIIEDPVINVLSKNFGFFFV